MTRETEQITIITDPPSCWCEAYQPCSHQAPAVHLMTGSSTVACGAPMRHFKTCPEGWDMGTAKVDPTKVTCGACLATFTRVR
jgi:hypothetical protein